MGHYFEWVGLGALFDNAHLKTHFPENLTENSSEEEESFGNASNNRVPFLEKNVLKLFCVSNIFQNRLLMSKMFSIMLPVQASFHFHDDDGNFDKKQRQLIRIFC